ncbi:hypothetical protein [Legionella fallonii]|uniref:Uncharacterized protein n=1 Tax=Legionella fallonii LLAP-10 TaxID=1212491 RepID=A0A098FZ87_9GAMM|nr:hypothetical protein [Legionella fallonii]CEG55532.1 conserved membrane protein of unknown function [Legionella fallonii LLAP-10]
MSMSKFKQWLDTVDPYAIQRIAFYKAVFLATILTYVYWLFLPVSFTTFTAPFFIMSVYEIPGISSFKKKEQLLLFIGGSMMFVSVSFYLVYPFRVIFFFFSVAVLTGLYFLVLRYFYALKNLTMLVIATGAIVLSTEPPANLQVAYGFISSIALSVITALICLRIFPNQYLTIWNRALQKFILYFEEDIENSIKHDHNKPIREEIIHFEMVRHYQRLVGRKYILPTYRIAVYIRSIQLSLDNLYYEEKNEIFWLGVKNNLHTLRLNMAAYNHCDLADIGVVPTTKLQHYIWGCLCRAFIHWNKLCALRKS